MENFLEGMYPLSGNRFVKIEKYKGNLLINIREYYRKNGTLLPSQKGISLSKDQFNCLKKYITSIDNDLRIL